MEVEDELAELLLTLKHFEADGAFAPKLLRVREVVQIIGLSRSKVYDLLASKKIESVKVGRAVRVPADALALWVARERAKQAEDEHRAE